jgi:hypothetical protein
METISDTFIFGSDDGIQGFIPERLMYTFRRK